MKKITLAALFCALFMAPSLKAQEVTYVEDPAQGYTFNKFKDNWFVSVEGGAGVLFSTHDNKLGFGKRIMPTANISVGKWFSPIIGLRLSADAQKLKGLTSEGYGIDPANPSEGAVDGYKINRLWTLGPTADVLINLTNWWCGYKPGRVYNGVLYGGFGAHTVWAKEFKNGNSGDTKLKYQTTMFGARAGLLNTFAISKQVDFLLDLRVDLNQSHFVDLNRNFSLAGSVLAGFAYKFNKREWKAPIVPVCPTYKYSDAEGDALVARLQAADSKIASLEQQLRDCMNKKPAATNAVEKNTEAPLATIYFPIGSSKVSAMQTKIVGAVANAMKNSDDKYVLTGWADNYTGTAKINDKLREDRANSVKKILVKNGVAADRLEAQANDNNLTTFGAKSATLDRAVTINVAK